MYNHKSETHKQNLVLVLKPKSRNSQLFLRYTIALILLFINPLLIDIMLPFTTLTVIIPLGYILICHKLNIFCERRCSFSLGVHQDSVEHSPLFSVNWNKTVHVEVDPYHQLVSNPSICPYWQDFGHFTSKAICLSLP